MSQTNDLEPGGALLIDVREVSRLLNLSTRSVWRMLSAGQLPEPVRIGRSVRWSRERIRVWIEAGCPQATEAANKDA